MQTTQQINEKFCQELAERLAAGEPIRCELPAAGYLHIDRQLPFLCVYRRPATERDTGTEQLVTSQAAYCIIPAEAERDEDWNRLIETIAAAQTKLFGGFLLLELWTVSGDEGHASELSLGIVAAASHAPAGLLETMEAALLRARIGERTPSIALQYRQAVSPPDRAPLLDEAQSAALAVTSIGLEINPFFRDPETGELYVYAHKEFRHRINRALKRSFYKFTHDYTSHRPAHFHELGPHALADPVEQVDQALADINSQFDLLLFVSPINSAEAWQEFSRNGYQRAPEFLYRSRTIDPALLKRRLYEMRIESIEDPTLAYIFEAKRDELDRQVTLLDDRNTPAFLLGSRQLFGDISPELLQLATDMLERMPPGASEGGASEMLNADQFNELAQEELQYYRQQDPTLGSTIEIRDDIPGIMVSHGNFLIGANASFSSARVQATLAHEIGTHVVTYHNGRQQPLQELYGGMAGYETLQEGLAVLSEYLVGELTQGRLRQLAGRVMAAHMIAEGADFVETFRRLCQDYGFADYGAYMMTMRTFRGGGYTKDGIYLQGLVEVLEYLGRGKDLQTLFVGKIASEYIPLIEELRWRQVLQDPILVPRLFTLPESQEKLRTLAKGCTVLDLMEEAA